MPFTHATLADRFTQLLQAPQLQANDYGVPTCKTETKTKRF